MNALPPKSGTWSRGKFLLVAVVLFAGQAAFVVVFAERSHPVAASVVPSFAFRRLAAPLDEQTLSKYVFATDPTIFSGSSPLGFAEQAWLRIPTDVYDKPTNHAEPPSFLEYAANQLGGSRMAPGPTAVQIPFDLADQTVPPRNVIPTLTGPSESGIASSFRIEGPLASRLVDPPNRLPSWTTNMVLSNSVVKFAVNRSGQVVSARLWAGSGLPDADTTALQTVGAMRFNLSGTSSAELTWDTAAFYWDSTRPPAATNAP